jgi:hypothetical protein
MEKEAAKSAHHNMRCTKMYLRSASAIMKGGPILLENSASLRVYSKTAFARLLENRVNNEPAFAQLKTDLFGSGQLQRARHYNNMPLLFTKGQAICTHSQ